MARLERKRVARAILVCVRSSFLTLLGAGALSLRRVVMLATAAGVILPAVFVGPLVAQESLRSDVQARIHALMAQYGSTLGAALVQPVWLADPVSAEGLLQSVMSNPDVVAIEVEDAALGAFLSKHKPSDVNDTLVRQVFPIVKDDKTIGTLAVTMTTRHVRSQLVAQATKLGLAIGFQLLLTLTILYFVFQRRLFQPVHALVNALRRMASGDLKTAVHGFGRGDELCDLAKGMDDMRVQLAGTLEEVRTLNAELEQRVHDRTRDLEFALGELKRAQGEIERSERMAALGAMVAGISHELNTPIGNSLTVSSTLVERTQGFQVQAASGLTRAQLQSFTQFMADASALVQRNLEKAAQLIGSFKQVAVDRTVADRREFELDRVIEEILTTLVAVFRRKGYVIESEIEPGIWMDSYPGQLGQVISNLVNNADLHGLEGRQGGSIRIQGKSLDPHSVELRITDNGKGIPPEHLGRVFDPFFTTKMGKGGTGLGLNIVHTLVHNLMGGDVRVESQVGSGTCFVVVIPRVAPAGAAVEAT